MPDNSGSIMMRTMMMMTMMLIMMLMMMMTMMMMVSVSRRVTLLQKPSVMCTCAGLRSCACCPIEDMAAAYNFLVQVLQCLTGVAGLLCQGLDV